MEQISIEKELQNLGFKTNDFDVERLSLQVKQLKQKINKVGDISNIKTIQPAFLLTQRCDQYGK